MKRLFALTFASMFAAVALAACVAGPDDPDSEEEEAEAEADAEETDDLDGMNEPEDDAAAAAGTIITKCGKNQRWCACGGCTHVDLKCSPYCE